MATKMNANEAPPHATSIDPEEVEKFRAMAAEWWDPNGKFAPLHKFNPVRLKFIRDTITAHYKLDNATRRPLEGMRILDIGCGGGLVSEPMARMGASMTSVDAGEANIKTAMSHAADNSVKIDYRVGTAEGLLDSGEPPFDVVLNLEVVEHVADPNKFLEDTAKLVKPGGIMILATLNRTPKALALAVIGAEYILGWLPRGTHDYEKFIRPHEMETSLASGAMSVASWTGVTYNPLSDRWSLSKDMAVNYMCVAVKDD